jgi:hypothetical protein
VTRLKGLPLEGDDVYGLEDKVKKIERTIRQAGPIPAGAVGEAQIAVGAINSGHLQTNSVTAAAIAANTITSDKIQAGAIAAGSIAAGAITSDLIAANAITTGKLNAEAVTSDKIAANTIVAGDIAANTITAAQIASATITATQIAANTITAGNIAANTITAAKIAAGTITATEIAAGAVTAGKLLVTMGGGNMVPNSSFESSAIGYGYSGIGHNVTTPVGGSVDLLGAGRMGGRSIRFITPASGVSSINVNNRTLYGAGTTSKVPCDVGKTYTESVWVKSDVAVVLATYIEFHSDLIGGAYTQNPKSFSIPANVWTRMSVTAVADRPYVGHYAVYTASAPNGMTLLVDDMQIEQGDVLSAYAPEVDEILPGTIVANQIAAETITSGQIAANAITTSELAADAVTAVKIAADTITAREIAANAITTSELNANAVTAAKIAANTITANEIAATTITATQIATDTITSNQIAANAITVSELAANAVVAVNIAANAVTTDKINAGAVTTDKITATSLSAITSNMGSITAGTITGATVQTATTGARVVMNSSGLTAYALNGTTPVFNLNAGTGVASFTGVATIAAGSVIPGSTLTGTIPVSTVPMLGGGNFVNDSSFESTAALAFTNAGTTVTSSKSTTQKKFGNQSLAVTYSSGTDPYTNYTLPASDLQAVRGSSVVYSAWVYIPSSVTAPGAGVTGRSILIYDNTTSREVAMPAVRDAWVRVICPPMTVTATAGSVTLRVYNGFATGTVYYDGIQLEIGEVATAYAPRPDELLPGSVGVGTLAANSVVAANLNVNIGGGNLLVNSSFEAPVANSGIIDWTFGGGAFVDNTKGRTGSSSVRLVRTTNEGPIAQSRRCFIGPDTAFVASMWVWVDASTTSSVWIDSYAVTAETGGTATPVGSRIYSDRTIIGSWQRVTMKGRTLANAPYLWLRIVIDSGASSAWVDDVQLEIGEIGTAYAPKPDEVLVGTTGGGNILENSSLRTGNPAPYTLNTNVSIVDAGGANPLSPVGYTQKLVKFVHSGGAAEEYPILGATTSTRYPVRPNTKYTISAWFYPTSANQYSNIGGYWLTSTGTLVAEDGAGWGSTLPANVWTRRIATLTSPATAAYWTPNYPLRARFSAGQVVYGAAFQMEEGSVASAYAPKPDEIIVGSISADKIGFSVGGSNLLPDSSYESSDTISGRGFTNAVITSETAAANVHGGGKSLKVTSSADGSFNTYSIATARHAVVSPGDVVTNSIWFKGIAGRVIQFIPRYLNSAGSFLSNPVTVAATATGAWQRQVVTTTVPATAAWSAPMVQQIATNSVAGDSFYIDDAQIEPGDVVTAYAPKTDEILPGTIVTASLADNAVTSVKVTDGSIVLAKIGPNAVDSTKIADNAVTTVKLVDSAISEVKIATGAISSTKLVDGAVLEAKLAANAVTVGKIADAAVATAKLADGAVTTGKILDAAVSTQKVATGAITTTTIADDAITTPKIVANAITAGKIAVGTITANEIAANAIAADELAANAVLAINISAGAVTTAAMTAGSINADRLVSNSITATQVAAGTITATEIAANSIDASKIVVNTITANEIATNAITADELAANSVLAVNILAGAVTTAAMTAGAINGDRITSNTLDASKITALSITANQLAAGAITANKLNVILGGENLLPNSSFEDGTSYYASSGANGAVPSQDTTTVYRGNKSLKLTFGAFSGQAGLGLHQIAQGSIIGSNQTNVTTGLKPLTKYTLSAWFYNPTTNGLSSGIFLSVQGAGNSGGTSGAFNTTRDAWVRLTATFTTTASGNNALYVLGNNPAAGQVAYVDAVQLEEGEVATAYSPMTSEILPGTIVATQIAAGTITATQLATDSVTATQIQAGAVTTAKMTANTINGNVITAATLDATKIVAASISATQIAASAITATQLASDSVTAIKILAGSITAAKMSVGTLSTNRVNNFSFENYDAVTFKPKYWGLGEGVDAGWVSSADFATDAGRSLKLGNGVSSQFGVSSNAIPVVPGEKYVFRAKVKHSNGNGTWYMRVMGRTAMPTDTPNITLANRTSNTDVVSQQATTNIYNADGRWFFAEYAYTVPAGIFAISPSFYNYGGSTGYLYVDEVEFCRSSNVTVIEDGTITTESIVAGTLNGDRIAANTINTLQINAGAVKTNQIDAGAVTAQKLTVAFGGNNRLPDSSFESTDALTGRVVTNATGSIDSSTAHNGGKSYKITASTAATSPSVYTSLAAKHAVISAGEVITYSGWIKAITGRSVALLARYLDPAGVYIAGPGSTTVVATGSWQRLSFTQVAPAGVGYVAPMIQQVAAGTLAGDIINVDDVQVEQGDVVSEYRPQVGEILPGTVGPTQITPDSITTNQIYSGAILANRIQAGDLNVTSLDALTANMGTLTAGTLSGVTITGGTVQTATTGARVVLTTAGLKAYASDGTTERISLTSAGLTITGGSIVSGTLTGTTSITSPSITGGSIGGSTVTGGVIQTASTGKRVILDVNGIRVYGGDGTVEKLNYNVGADTFTLSGATLNAPTINGTVVNAGTITGGTITGTVITGGTVTGTTITGATITGGTLQTSDAGVNRLKLSASGLEAYEANMTTPRFSLTSAGDINFRSRTDGGSYSRMFWTDSTGAKESNHILHSNLVSSFTTGGVTRPLRQAYTEIIADVSAYNDADAANTDYYTTVDVRASSSSNDYAGITLRSAHNKTSGTVPFYEPTSIDLYTNREFGGGQAGRRLLDYKGRSDFSQRSYQGMYRWETSGSGNLYVGYTVPGTAVAGSNMMRLMVFFGGTGWLNSTAGQPISQQLFVNGTVYAEAFMFANEAGSHKTYPANNALVNVNPGQYLTFQIIRANSVGDVNDRQYLSVITLDSQAG